MRSTRAVKALVAEMVLALRDVHMEGLLFREVKLSNFLLTGTGLPCSPISASSSASLARSIIHPPASDGDTVRVSPLHIDGRNSSNSWWPPVPFCPTHHLHCVDNLFVSESTRPWGILR